MGFQLRDPKERADVIAYLRQESSRVKSFNGIDARLLTMEAVFGRRASTPQRVDPARVYQWGDFGDTGAETRRNCDPKPLSRDIELNRAIQRALDAPASS